MAALNEAARLYKARFGDVPTLAGLPVGRLARAAELLMEAVRRNVPIGSDAAWYRALDLEPPPPGAVL